MTTTTTMEAAALAGRMDARQAFGSAMIGAEDRDPSCLRSSASAEERTVYSAAFAAEMRDLLAPLASPPGRERVR